LLESVQSKNVTCGSDGVNQRNDLIHNGNEDGDGEGNDEDDDSDSNDEDEGKDNTDGSCAHDANSAPQPRSLPA
jgi:hypothetical protein